MKLSLTFVAAMLYACPTSAQLPSPNVSQPTSQINAASNAAQSITLSGCVGSINQAPGQFSLSSAVLVPASAQPGTPPATAVAPPPVSPTTPPTAATPPQPTPPPAAPAPPASTTPGSAATGATPPTAGAAPSGVNASATATQPSAIAAGYRLSGLDMSSWSGKRVQIVGNVVPSTVAGSSATTPVGTTGTMGKALPEFRVQNVTPATGDCPPQQN